MMKNLSDSLLPQPPSFNKKKSYDVHQVLGTGTFGKVMVRLPNSIFHGGRLTRPCLCFLCFYHHVHNYRYSEQHGRCQLTRLPRLRGVPQLNWSLFCPKIQGRNRIPASQQALTRRLARGHHRWAPEIKRPVVSRRRSPSRSFQRRRSRAMKLVCGGRWTY